MVMILNRVLYTLLGVVWLASCGSARLSFYIDPSIKYPEVVQTAFEVYNHQVGNPIFFEIDTDEANIRVVANIPLPDPTWAGMFRPPGLIVLHPRINESKELTYAVMVHEIGHALGFPDLYDDRDCIMQHVGIGRTDWDGCGFLVELRERYRE